MTAELAQEMERKVNEEILAKRNITSSILPREEAMQIPDLIRTKINLLPQGITEVRVVNIQGLDLQADGGTHVENTSEVKQIYVVGHESKGKINKRIKIRIADYHCLFNLGSQTTNKSDSIYIYETTGLDLVSPTNMD